MSFLRTNYQNYHDIGLEGGIVDSFPHDIDTYANASGEKSQVSTLTIGTAAGNTEYRVSFLAERQGVSENISITSSASATGAAITAQLMAALQANTILNSLYSFTSSGTTITVTAKLKGEQSTFSIFPSGGGTGFTTQTTEPPTNPETLAFGRLVSVFSGAGSDGKSVIIPSAASDLQNLVGAVIRTDAYAQQFPYYSGEGAFPYQPVNVMQQGRFYIRPVTDIAFSDPIHVYISGVNKGRVAAAADGANTAPYTGTGFKIFAKIKAGQIGIAHIKLP